MSLYVKKLQSYSPTNFEDDLELDPGHPHAEGRAAAFFFQISNLNCLQLCSPLSNIKKMLFYEGRKFTKLTKRRKRQSTIYNWVAKNLGLL